MADEIKQKITVEADEAVRNVNKLSAAEKGMADETRKVDDAARGAADGLDQKGQSVVAMATKIAASVASLQVFLKVVTDIEERAKGAAAAVAELGESSKGLSVNVGGELANEVVDQITAISADNKFGPGDRDELIEATTAITDLRDDQTKPQLVNFAKNAALLKRVTGIGGKQAALTIQAIAANFGVSDDIAVDAAANLINSGFDPAGVQRLATSGAGKDFASLTLASRAEGVNLQRSSRQVNALVENLLKTDESGNVAKPLADVGVTDEMIAFERFEFLAEGLESGRIPEAQFRAIVGGQATAEVVPGFLKAIGKPGVFQAAQRAMFDPRSAENQLARLQDNPKVRAAERAKLRELMVQVSLEESSMSGVGESIAQGEAMTEAEGGTNFLAIPEFINEMRSVFSSKTPEQIANENVQTIKADLGLGPRPGPESFLDIIGVGPERDSGVDAMGAMGLMPVQGTVVNNYFTGAIFNSVDPARAEAERLTQE